MKGMKGKLLKKLQSIKPIGYLKPDRVLQVNASDGFEDNFPRKSDAIKEEEPKKANQSRAAVQEPEIIDVTALMRDLEDEEMDLDDDINDKENVKPEAGAKDSFFPEDGENIKPGREISSWSKPPSGRSEAPKLPESRNCHSKHVPLAEIDVSNFRRPDLDSGTLFDPNLLAAFEQAVMEIKAQEAERRARIEKMNSEKIQLRDEEEEPPLKARKIEEGDRDPLLDFEEKCPPGGSDSVIFYTTGLRGIRKTFEECNSVRFLLESLRVMFFERDVSMHSEFREELWRTLGGKIVPPRLFIKGRYIGGAEVVLTLHEQGKLRPLFQGVPIDRSEGPCEGCAGFRFVMCFTCNGSHKAVSHGDGSSGNCPDCNENGLIICPMCC